MWLRRAECACPLEQDHTPVAPGWLGHRLACQSCVTHTLVVLSHTQSRSRIVFGCQCTAAQFHAGRPEPGLYACNKHTIGAPVTKLTHLAAVQCSLGFGRGAAPTDPGQTPCEKNQQEEKRGCQSIAQLNNCELLRRRCHCRSSSYSRDTVC